VLLSFKYKTLFFSIYINIGLFIYVSPNSCVICPYKYLPTTSNANFSYKLFSLNYFSIDGVGITYFIPMQMFNHFVAIVILIQ
jgi:hypothetical protein